VAAEPGENGRSRYRSRAASDCQQENPHRIRRRSTRTNILGDHAQTLQVGEEEFYVVLGNSIYEHLATAPPVFRSSTPGSRSTHLNILTTREKQNANLQAGRAKPSVFDNYTVHFFDPELNQQCTTDAFRATRV